MQIPNAEQLSGNESLESYAVKMATKYGLDAGIFVSMLKVESGLQQTRGGAVIMGSAGEIGVSQLKPGTAAEMGVNPFNALENIEGGAKYLRKQLDATGDYTLALAAYNQGLAGSRGKGHQAGKQYADKVLQLRNNSTPAENHSSWFDRTFTEGGTARTMFSSIAQNGGIIVLGLGIIFIAVIMTGRNTAVQTVKDALK